MLSFETELRVGKILVALSESERSIEISRQVLCDNYDFDSYQVFREIDLEGKNKLDACNIIDFLKRRSVYATHCDAEFIIQFYDEDGDNALSYSEFLNMVHSSNSFRKSTRSDGLRMPFNVEYSMGKLLEKELDLARNISMLIADVKLRYDFNVHDIFHSLKSWNAITSESLKNFLDRQGLRYLESDIRAIIKRLDINNDGRVDLVEFSSFFGCPVCHCGHCSYCCCSCCHHHVCSRSSSPLRSSGNIEKVNESKIMGASISNALNSTYQTSSPKRNERSLAYSPEVKRVSPNLSLRLSPERRFSPNRGFRNSPRNSPLRQSNNISTIRPSPINYNYEERQFLDYLRTLMETETTIERMKIDLALRCDFNVEDAFRVFELDGRGFLTEDDLKFGLSLLDIYATNTDVRLLMKRFDLQKKGVLNFGDFFDMVTPYEREYRTMVENRPPNHCCCCRSLDAFMCVTSTCLQTLLRTLISAENKCNAIKGGFSSLRCNLRQVFSSIDLLSIGYFTDSDFERYLKRKNAFTIQKESDLVFIHLDRNRDGRIEYWEVSDALAPVY